MPDAPPRRWHRLRPADAADVALLVVMAGGALAFLLLLLGGSTNAGSGGLALVFGLLLLVNASTPLFLFLGLALYLTRRGRTIGPDRRWVWAGLLVTLPLVPLVGQPLSVRGLGDITAPAQWLVNLGALALMAVGVRRTLRSR